VKRAENPTRSKSTATRERRTRTASAETPPGDPPGVRPESRVPRALRPDVYLLTFGCRAQQADEEALRLALQDAGLPVLEGKKAEGAGIAVIHGCVVTVRAERDARKAIRRLRREHPELRIVVTGCYARLAGDDSVRALGADLVLPQAGPAELAQAIRDRLAPKEPARGADAALPGTGRRRVALRVQDGCDGGCAYCIVPLVRGAPKSVPLESLLEQVRRLAAAGVPEVVLSGIQTGAWGRDLEPAADLPELLERLLALPGRPRLRVSSVEPQFLTERLIEIVTGDRGVCPHLHVPIQSGSSRLLAAMGRADPAPSIALLEHAWARHADLAVGFDVIAGLPTETEAEHEATLELVERLPLAYLHVFTYSARPGTRAAEMQPAVPERFAVLRTRAFLRTDARLRAEYRARVLARGRAEVAVEFVDLDGVAHGTTERFVPAVIVSRNVRVGSLVRGATDGLASDGALRIVPDRPA